jgi:hypothetical protein
MLAGTVAGLRFKVLATVPITVVGIFATGTLMLFQGEQVGPIMGAILVNTVCLQVCYLVGSLAVAVMRDSRPLLHGRTAVAQSASAGMAFPRD